MKWYIVDIDSVINIHPYEQLDMLFVADDSTLGTFTKDLAKARVFKLKREAVAWMKENLIGDIESFWFYLPMKEPDVILHKMGVK